MRESIKYTIEDLQQVCSSQTLPSSWIKRTTILIPIDVCNKAAEKLIEVLGGERITRQLVGGTIWWQVRSTGGVSAEWISLRDKEDMKHRRSRKFRRPSPEPAGKDSEYDPDMNNLPCVLFFHGGGYFMGSVDQERYSTEHMAIYAGCRILTISYRLAPQYPFPCALQDALAAYLYLVDPPSGAKHTVRPKQLIISGDSAGGGLALALLQVIRDLGLPRPAGGILISPWCDLTHSFPSVLTNTKTDFIPKYGLSIFRPSHLWPPPSDEQTANMHSKIRSHVNQAAGRKGRTPSTSHVNRDSRSDSTSHSVLKSSKRASTDPTESRGMNATATRNSGSSSSLKRGQEKATADCVPSTVLPRTEKSEDKVLRARKNDGGILEVKDQVHMYAPNNLLRHPLVSPALSYLGGLPPLLVFAGDGEVLRDEIIYTAHKAAHPKCYPVHPETRKMYPKFKGIEEHSKPTKVHLQVYDNAPHVFPLLCFLCESAKICFGAMWTFIDMVIEPLRTEGTSPDHSDQCSVMEEEVEADRSVRFADDWRLYEPPTDGESNQFRDNTMIRIRVSAKGEVRPLERQSELPACTLPSENIGAIDERILCRYLEGTQKWKERFSKTEKHIHKKRGTSLNYVKNAPPGDHRHEKHSVQDKAGRQANDGASDTSSISHQEDVPHSSNMNWAWAWAVKDDEYPPPSSIVARLDTKEARQLAKIAEKPCKDPTKTRLWSRIICDTKPDRDGTDGSKQKTASGDARGHSTRGSESELTKSESHASLGDRKIRGTFTLLSRKKNHDRTSNH
ncbi:alpha/beta-hydrolase [Fomitiporia mediterranea MF3/22]|uniref:alpha/beta-hydrolase n=1 Tax=Fomitiporia mediterranea (strain MF3/22) TaxID=694068 RepID=UPI0004408DF3|nr:alpha/beta-hydrolase [Fomitiporia mediterranea MF3/22]EJD08016.1 alpha/beta-hydrolase [Fomitiporia mediterranea MF3/22]